MLLQAFQRHINQHFPQLSVSGSRLLLAVSGGVDSVVLTDLIAKSGFDFAIAHCNFQLRGEESERDEKFVKQFGSSYQTDVFIQKFDTKNYAAERKLSIQEAARELRYNWFGAMVNGELSMVDNSEAASSFSYILTAHHADDNIETLLMHFFRGTGIHGLTAIPSISKERKIIRPLLFATREQILQYANEHQLKWIEDSSNASEKYTRNYFRHTLIPSIAEVFPKVQQNLSDNIERFIEADLLYTQAIELHKKKLLEHRGNEVHIPILKLKKSIPLKTVLHEIIKPYHFSAAQVDEVIKLFDAENGSFIKSDTHRIIKNRGWLIIAPCKTEDAAFIVIEDGNKTVLFEEGKLHIEAGTNLKPNANNSIALLDALVIKFPLLLRKVKQGDYFYPLGMQKKKKISRFLIDQKLSQTDKEKVWVLESNKRIVWVIGYRIDDRFKITDNTRTALKIFFTHNS